MNFATQRTWKVVNDNKTTGIGAHPAYKLVPGAAFPPMFDPSSAVLDRCRAIEHTVWVTPNSADERWPLGEFVNQSGGGLGLPEWTAADRPIENTDVVLWYIFGIHHITRPEDWPIMPADTISFWLKPFGFFDRNPALDVAPTPKSACHTEGRCRRVVAHRLREATDADSRRLSRHPRRRRRRGARCAATARSLSTGLEISMVLPPETVVDPPGNYEELLTDRAESWLAEAADLVDDDVSVTTHISFHESSAEGIITEAERVGAELIVVGDGEAAARWWGR